MGNFVKISSLLALFLLLGCERDDGLRESDNRADLRTNYISLEDAVHRGEIEQRLAEYGLSPYQKSENDSLYVLTDSITEVLYEDGYTYSFPLIRKPAHYYVENLVLDYDATTEQTVEWLVQYDITDEQYQELYNGYPSFTPSDQVRIYRLADGTIAATPQKSCTRTGKIVYVPCSSGKHNAGNTDEWHNCIADRKPSFFLSWSTTCEPYETPIQSFDAEHERYTGGGGGANSSPAATSPCTHTGSSSIGMGDGDGGCNQLGEPSEHAENCNELRSFSNDNTLDPSQSNADTLSDMCTEAGKENSGPSQGPQEEYYVVDDDGQGGITTEQGWGEPYADAVTGIRPPLDGSRHTLIHSHHSHLLPMFSYEDLKALQSLYWNRAGNLQNLNVNITLILTTSTNQIYALKVSDGDALNQFISDMNITVEGEERTVEGYINKLEYIDDMSNSILFEQKFLNFIEGSGLDCYQMSNLTHEWKKIELDANGNIKPTPC